MDRAVDLQTSTDVATVTVAAEDENRIVVKPRDRPADYFRPISIQINVGNDRDRRRRDETGFRLSRSKVFWLIVMFSLSVGVAYARTRYVCQSFKDDGRFFYGMGVDRCVHILIKQPFDQIGSQLDTINRSY